MREEQLTELAEIALEEVVVTPATEDLDTDKLLDWVFGENEDQDETDNENDETEGEDEESEDAEGREHENDWWHSMRMIDGTVTEKRNACRFTMYVTYWLYLR